MRSLHLIPHLEAIDGIQRGAFELCRGLAAEGSVPVVAPLRHGNMTASWSLIADVRPACEFLALSPRRCVTAARGLPYVLALPRDVDVVVAHRVDLLNAAAIVARRASCPLCLHAHNAAPPWLRWRDCVRVPGSRAVGKVVVSSRFMAASWADRVGSVPVEIVTYPIDTTYFHFPTEDQRQVARNRLGLRPDKYVVGFVGRIEEIKGVHTLAAAVDTLSRMQRNVHFLAQGGPGLGVSDAAARAYRLRCVELLGECPATWIQPGPDVREVLAASDVCVVPSAWPEPSGLVVSEALAMGIPVVASNVGGIPEQMPESPYARLFAASDVGDLVSALRAVCATRPELADRWVLRRHVEQTRQPWIAARRYQQALEFA